MSSDEETSPPLSAPPVPPPPTPWSLPDNLRLDDYSDKRLQKEMQFHMVGAIEGGDTKLLSMLIESGVDTNATILLVKTPLAHAVEQETVNNDIIKLLLDGMADPNLGEHSEWGKMPLHTVAAKNLVDTANLFFDYTKEDGSSVTNVDIRDNGRMSPLHFAAKYGNNEMVTYLISQSADIHAKDDCWKTPIHRAIEELHFDTMAILVENGASVNSADIDGWTPLFHSVFFGHIEMVQLLILTGADVNHVSLDAHTPLHIACSVQRPSRRILKKELSSSFDYYYRTRNMSTDEFKRFFLTNKLTNIEMVQILVNAGADVNAISDAGETPVNQTEDLLVQKYLILAGGRVDEDDLICPGGYGNGNRQVHGTDESNQPFATAAEYQNWIITQCSLQYTLLRLCRTAIRKYLANTYNISESIKKLPVPEPLKSCLNLDDFEPEFVER